MEKMSTFQVSKVVALYGLGKTVDEEVHAGQIEDPKLAKLWLKADTILNEIQLYLEEELAEEFFKS